MFNVIPMVTTKREDTQKKMRKQLQHDTTKKKERDEQKNSKTVITSD